MLRIPFELLEFELECFESLSNAWFEFGFECFEPLSNGLNLLSNASNLHLNASILHSIALNPFRMVRIHIWMLKIPFESFEFASECFASLSSGSNLDSNASIPFRKVRICIRMLRILFELFEFAFECLKIPLKWFEFGFECFESLSNCLNFHSNV